MNIYDKVNYDELHGEEQLAKLELIKDKISGDDSVLDVGCGTGLSATVLEENKVVGVDVCDNLLKKAKKRMEVKKAKASELPLKDDSFDTVLCLTSIHHFDLEKSIEEMKRVGKKIFIISVLKKSRHARKIMNKIDEEFKVKEMIEEDKDFIFVAEK